MGLFLWDLKDEILDHERLYGFSYIFKYIYISKFDICH